MSTEQHLAGATRQPTPPIELPQVVWLRGDEAYFSEFSLDADAVMEQLGIKRSRLRQISGRELRVGRCRQQRYIKPLYRPQDVDAYHAWTRAPASQTRSSELIHEAAAELLAESHKLQGIIAAAVERSARQACQQYERFAHELKLQQRQQGRALDRRIEQLEIMQRQHRRQAEALAAAKQAEQQDLLAPLQELPELASRSREHGELLSQGLGGMQHELAELAHELRSDVKGFCQQAGVNIAEELRAQRRQVSFAYSPAAPPQQLAAQHPELPLRRRRERPAFYSPALGPSRS